MATHLKQVLVDALGEETQEARRATGVSSPSAGAVAAPAAVPVAPNPEVVQPARRRRFTAKYKLAVLEQADRCEPGQLGALLRREGRYSSHLCVFHAKVDTDSTGSRTVIPRQGGHRFQGKLDT